ncbi:MAG: hypothetical protein U1F52_19745 [Burkholderiales bacterium]
MTPSPRPRNRRKLLAIWAVLIALIAVILVIQQKDRKIEHAADLAERTGSDREGMLLPLMSTQLGALEVAHSGTVHRFERDAAGLWFYHSAHAKVDGSHGHQTDPAMAERIAKALVGLGKCKLERTFPFDPKSNEYGVTTPQTVLLAYAPNRTEPVVQYAVGDLAPDGVSQYVFRLGGNEVRTIPGYQVDNLLNLIKVVTGPPSEAVEKPMPGGLPEVPAKKG